MSWLAAAARSPRACAAAAFFLSRLVYRLVVGVELDASPVYYFLQFLDPHYLQTDSSGAACSRSTTRRR